jgi:hypothetical protein
MFSKHGTEIIVGLLLFLIIFVPRTADLGRFQGHDELMRNRESLDSFQALIDGRWGDVYSSNFGGTNLTWAQTGYRLYHFLRLRLLGEDVTLRDMANYGPDFNPLPGAIFNGLLLVILYPFLRKLFGWPTAALTTTILALDPYLLSEARILRTEAAYATFITLSAVTLALYARTHQRRYLIWTGFWTAWTIATKISGVILGPIIFAVLLVMAWNRRHTLVTTSQKIKTLALDLGLVGMVTMSAVFLVWPTLWEIPFQTFAELYDYIIFFGVTSKGLDFFYLGTTVENLPAAYYLIILGYKSTPLSWLGLSAFIWSAWNAKKQPTSRVDPTWAGFRFPEAAGLIILLSGIIFVIAMSIAKFKTERYMMAPISNFDVVAALGLMALGRQIYTFWITRRFPKPVYWFTMILILFLGLGLFTWLNHPYYFSHYNPILGGGYTAVNTVQVGSGEVLDRAIDYLNEQPDPEEQLVVCGTNLPRCEYRSKGQKFIRREALNPIHSDWVAADYVVTYVFQEQRGDYPQGVIDYLARHKGPVYVADFQGIEYSRVYQAPQAQYVAASELTGISTLLGYTLNGTTLNAGGSLKIKYYLQNDGQIVDNIFVYLVDTDNYIWSQTTGQLLSEFEELTDERGAILEGQADLVLPIGMPPGRYFLKMGYQSSDGELIGLFSLPEEGDTIEAVPPEQFPADFELPYTLNLKIDPTLAVAGYGLDSEPWVGGQTFWLTLFWRATANVQRDYVVNLRLLNTANEEVAYWLGRPVRSGYPTYRWQAGQIVQDPWRLDLPNDLLSGDYRLEIVLFDANTQTEVVRTVLQTVAILDNSTGENQ